MRPGPFFLLAFLFSCAPAYAAPPVLELPASASVIEGETLRVPFKATDPDLNEITRSVTWMVGGVPQSNLPAGAELVRDPMTATWSLIWWPNPLSNLSGSYLLRFRAQDSQGESVQQDMPITVLPRAGSNLAGTPSIKVSWGSYYVEDGGFYILYPIVPGDTFVVQLYSKTYAFALGLQVVVADPQGIDRVTLEGPAAATLTRENDTTYTVFWQAWDSDAGTHPFTLTAFNRQGAQSRYLFSVEVRKSEYAGRIRARYLVFPRNGLIVAASGADLLARYQGAVFQGRVTLDAQMIDDNTGGVIPPPTDMTIRYIVVTPDGKQVVSPDISGPPFTYVWDTTQSSRDGQAPLPDGTYALGLEIVGAADPSKFYDLHPGLCSTFFIDNGMDGPLQGAQWLPAVGGGFYKNDTATMGADAVQWVWYDPAQQPTPRPYPFTIVPPASQNPPEIPGGPSSLIDPNNWFSEPVFPDALLYHDTPQFHVTKAGHLYVGRFGHDPGSVVDDATAENQKRGNFDPGPRYANGSISPVITIVGMKNGFGWFAIDLAGRLMRVDPDGRTTLLTGREDLPVIKYYARDPTVTTQELEQHQQRWKGSFDGPGGGVPFNKTVDLWQDPNRPEILYVADTGNHAIRKVDLTNTANPSITTIAGQLGVSGDRDGGASQALFNQPFSVAGTPDGATLYVADFGNHKIRQINLATGAVATLVGDPARTPTAGELAASENLQDLHSRDNRAFAGAIIPGPMVVRLDSDQNVVFISPLTNSLHRLDLANRVVRRIFRHSLGFEGFRKTGNWVWMDIDVTGTSGPLDDILVAGYGSFLSIDGSHDRQKYGDWIAHQNAQSYRISKDGSRVRLLMRQGDGVTLGLNHGRAAHTYEPMKHYLWAMAVHPLRAGIATTGFGNLGAAFFRPALSTDTLEYNGATFFRGFNFHERGTVARFPFSARPSIAFLAERGFHRFPGSVKNVDELSDLSTSQLRAFIQAGWGGKKGYPEVTGPDLEAAIYWIRRSSTSGSSSGVDLPQIRADLIALGELFDSVKPEIWNLATRQLSRNTTEISFKTSEPAIGVARFDPYGRSYAKFSEMEPAYTQQHSIVLKGLLANHAYFAQVHVKDRAGNYSVSDFAFTQGAIDPDTTPPVISGVTAGSITSSGAAITWTTDELSDSQVEYGLTTSYGNSTPLNPSLVTSHSQALTGLSAGTLYHYRVKSKDASGNLAVSLDFTFATLPSAVNLTLKIPGGSSQKGAEGVPFSSMVLATVTPAAALTLTASGLPAGAAFMDQGGGIGMLDWLPNFTQAGIYTVTFTAASGAQSVSTTLEVDIQNTADAPVFSLRLPETPIAPNQTTSVPLTAWDPEGDRVTFTLADSTSYASGAAALTDRGDGTATISFTPDKAGYHYLLVTLTDPSGNSRTVPVVFRVGTLIRSAQSGPWSSPNTWDLGVVPTASHRVLIEHHTVTLDTQAEAVEVIVQHHGMLHASRQVSSSLRLTGSLAVLHSAHLDAGTAAEPIPAGITTEILFTVPSDAVYKGNSPYLPGSEPGMPDLKLADIGLWVMDEGSYATLHGAPIQNPWVRLLADAQPGSSQMEVDASVADWTAGSQILVTSWDNPDWTEIRRIDSIQGNRITLDSPAAYFHPGRRYAYHKTTQALRLLGAAESPLSGEVLVRNQCEAALLTRNLTITSDLSKGQGKAHTLAMMGGKYSVAYTQLKDMGPKQPKGPFGRYPLHLHRVGEGQGIAFTGNAVWNTGTSGHQGIVLHDTDGALVEKNTVYNVQGPPIDTERATEQGNVIRGNLLAKFTGSDPTPQEDLALKFGYPSGFTAGIWVRPNNTVTDNGIVFGQGGAAGLGITPSTLSPSPGAATILGNTVRGSPVGIAFFGQQLAAGFQDGVLAGNTVGLIPSPGGQNRLIDSVLLDNQDQPDSDAAYMQRHLELTAINNIYVKLPFICGDYNGDGKVDLADVVQFIRGIVTDTLPAAGTSAFRRSDVNGDELLNIADPVLLIKHILGQAQLVCRGG